MEKTLGQEKEPQRQVLALFQGPPCRDGLKQQRKT